MPSPTHSVSVVDVSRQAVRSLLERLGLDIPSYQRDPGLESRVSYVLRSWGFEHQLQSYLAPALILTTTCYHHIADIEIKVCIALFGTLAIALDDPSILNAQAPDEFHRRLCSGAVQGETNILGRLTSNLNNMWGYYSPFSASSIFTSALQFVNGCLLEQCANKGIALNSNALPFITYRRNMSGLAEAVAHLIWTKDKFPDIEVYMQAIPDICWYQNHVNDILSFYKEELSGETGNYMSDRAAASGKTTLETLREVIDETVVIVQRIRNILGEGEARDAWESFARGWIAFYTSSPRYRLKELIDCEYTVISD
ncbi:terpenoid synthase [Wolfiporia cocos MD-104 SS10]|uniref:Terpenoid synthase n=1 Tax=Wolfiporia cocos (strain MD-104) TaxID=742152 RepID=A0A2H3JDY8_WOLCO|nr:terpenoid synthase [Wolfiporia cocos MD-104 SS10]